MKKILALVIISGLTLVGSAFGQDSNQQPTPNSQTKTTDLTKDAKRLGNNQVSTSTKTSSTTTQHTFLHVSQKHQPTKKKAHRMSKQSLRKVSLKTHHRKTNKPYRSVSYHTTTMQHNRTHKTTVNRTNKLNKKSDQLDKQHQNPDLNPDMK